MNFIKHLLCYNKVVLFFVIISIVSLVFNFNTLANNPEEPLWEQLQQVTPITNKNFVVIIPSYNNKEWYQKNLDSVFMQKYDNYRVIYVDDCSPDGTGNLVEQYIKEKGQEHGVTLIKNKERQGHMANWYNTIHSCNATDIVVQLDGDDWFAHDHVLALLNKVYANSDVWLTYGQYKQYPLNEYGICHQIPENVIKSNNFRSYKWATSHLRTFYAWLFQLIRLEDFKIDNTFIPMACDRAMIYPMLEMAGSRIKFIPDIVYIYNRASSINCDKINVGLQLELSNIVQRKERYHLVDKPSIVP